LLDACEARGVSVLAAAPFNSGLLSRPWPPDGAHFDYGPAPNDVLARARALASVCERHGVQLPHAAMQFPLRSPAAASVVAGMRTGTHARTDIAWVTESLPDDLWADLG
jgi:D-threo-aldose 1-dehydrogenase